MADEPAKSTTLTPWQRATLADIAEINFEAPITNLKTADCHALSDQYRKAAQGDSAAEVPDTPASRVFNMLWSLTGMFFKPDDRNDPFGPMMTLADGRRTAIPSDFRGESLEVLAYMAERATNPVLHARLCDTCWLLDRKRAVLGIEAISSYCEIVRLVDEKLLAFPHEDEGADQAISHNARDLLRRALQISQAIGFEKQETIEARHLASELRKRAVKSGNVIPILWFSNLDLDFEISEAGEVAGDIEQLFKNSTNLTHEADLWKLAARAYHLAKKEDQKNRCQSEAAECLVAEAEKHSGSAMLASHWLTAAINQLHGLPNKKERRNELRHRLIDVQAHISEEMKLFSQELDVKEIAERVKEAIEKVSFVDKLFVFADLARSPDPAALRAEAVKLIQKHPLSSLFDTTHHDSEGKVIHRTPGGGLGSDDDPVIERQIAESERMRRHIAAVSSIDVTRRSIVDHHFISEDVLASLLKYSPFVPHDLVVTFSRGFTAFFRGDLISAVYILTPLLENSLRHVLKAHGHDVTILDDAT